MNTRHPTYAARTSLLHELRDRLEAISAEHPDGALTSMAVDEELSQVTALLPNLDQPPTRYISVRVVDDRIRVTVHNVAYTNPPHCVGNRSIKLYLESVRCLMRDKAIDGGTDNDAASLLALHLEQWLHTSIAPGDLIRTIALSTNLIVNESAACHDPRDGELLVTATRRLVDGIPDDFEDLIAGVVGHATIITTFVNLLTRITSEFLDAPPRTVTPGEPNERVEQSAACGRASGEWL